MNYKKVTAEEIQKIHRNRMDFSELLHIAYRMNVYEPMANRNAKPVKKETAMENKVKRNVQKFPDQEILAQEQESRKREQNKQFERVEKLKNPIKSTEGYAEMKIGKLANGKNPIKSEAKINIDFDRLDRKLERAKTAVRRDLHMKHRKSVCQKVSEPCNVPEKSKAGFWKFSVLENGHTKDMRSHHLALKEKERERIKAARDHFQAKQEAMRLQAKADRECRVRERIEARQIHQFGLVFGDAEVYKKVT